MNPETRALEIEAGVANLLMRTAQELLAVQGMTQREDVPTISAHLTSAAELRVEIVFGPHPHIRVVTVDTQGEDVALLRRLDLALPQTGAQH